MRCKLRGKYWSIVFEKLHKSTLGLCDWSSRKITISTARKVNGELQLDTIIHELLHACQPDLAEETVEETASDIARVLTKLGYRRS
jgi:hypothetical protein